MARGARELGGEPADRVRAASGCASAIRAWSRPCWRWFSLQGTSRTTEGTRHPDRDPQFRYINDQVKELTAAGQPVLSVDAKKKLRHEVARGE